MTTKAEKLARELIALSERYSERDFDRASELLLSGELFSKAVGTARDTRAAVNSAKRKSKTKDRLPQSGANPANAADSHVQLDLDDLLRGFDESGREELVSFAKRFQSREVLENGTSVRVFAEQLGIQLPKKLPARPALLKSVLRELRCLSQEERSRFLTAADRIGNGESSLQRWSDLIVKREPD